MIMNSYLIGIGGWGAGVVIALGFLVIGFQVVDSKTYAVTNSEIERCGLAVE